MLNTPAQSTRIADVEKQLGQLWAQTAEANGTTDAALRATTMNMVIYTTALDRAQQTAAALIENHPGRVIIVTPDDEAPGALTATPTVVCRAAFGQAHTSVCGEQVTITAGTDRLESAAQAVQSLLLPDQYTYLLWLADLDATHPLLTRLASSIDGLIVDSGDFADAELGLRKLARLKESGTFDSQLFDLNWQRVLPYCIAIANRLDPAHAPGAIATLKRIEVIQQNGRAEALLLVGWFADRLGWRVAKGQAADTWTARTPDGIIDLAITASTQPEADGQHIAQVTITTAQQTLTLRYLPENHCIMVTSALGSAAQVAAPIATEALLDDLLNSGIGNTLYSETLGATTTLFDESTSQHAGIVLVENAESLIRLAARKIVTYMRNAFREHDRFTVALSGGSTPKALYELLAMAPFRDEIDWTRVHLFWGDERNVAPDHANSNQRMARETLIDKVPIPAANVHPIDVGERFAADAAADYAAHIRAFFSLKAGELPEFDLVLLGLGEDGHTASLFPHTAALDAPDDALFVANVVPQLDTTRLTLTRGVINNAVNVLLLVSGAAKATILQEVLHGPYQPTEHPIQLINPAGGLLTVLADRAAAAKLH